jgi:hypothetical protein
MLKRHAQDPVSEVTSVDELKEFFADEAEHGTDGRQSEENPFGNVIIRARPLRRKDRPDTFRRETATSEEDDNGDGESEGEGEGEGTGEGGTGYGGGNGGSREGPGQGGGAGVRSNRENTPARVRLKDVRSVPVTPRTRRVAFTPDYSGEIKLAVQDSGADANFGLKVVRCSRGTVSKGLIEHVNVTADRRCVIEVELESDFHGAMRVIADAI